MATVESVTKAYSRISPDRYADQDELLDAVRDLYSRHGIKALATPFLERQRFGLYQCLLAAGLKQPILLERLGLAAEYAAWKQSHRSYRGASKPTWSWDVAVVNAAELVSRKGDLPTVEWCRLNGHSSLTNAVHNAGRVWEDLRIAVGLPPSRNFCQSSNGMRWLSQAEALLSDFLHARGVEHKPGERYAPGYEKQSGRKWGRYDLHFRDKRGDWINVEVWGNSLSGMSGGRYQETKAFKEAWHADSQNFLGISGKDCLSQKKLARILEPFMAPSTREATSMPLVAAAEMSRYASKSEVLAKCRALAAQMPDGVYPGDSWLRKRGKHANRPGPPDNALSVYVNRLLGGTRAVRELLGQSNASTIKWTAKKAVEAWDAFEAKTGLTPSQCMNPKRRSSLPAEIRMEARKIYEVASRLGQLEVARKGRSARRVIWTPEHIRFQWRAFVRKHGKTPSECMSKVRRQTMPRSVADEATRIYDAARRLGLLAELRGEDLSAAR